MFKKARKRFLSFSLIIKEIPNNCIKSVKNKTVELTSKEHTHIVPLQRINIAQTSQQEQYDLKKLRM